jgi:DegV family protein with EDD domain
VKRPCALVVDSGSVLADNPDDGTRVIPLNIVFGEQVLRDGIDISLEEFYTRLDGGEVPKTSTPSPGEYLAAYRSCDAEHIVCPTIPAHLSAMHESASLAARLLAAEGDERQVHVIDTGTGAAGFGLVARAAAELCAARAPAKEVLDRVETARHEVRMYGSLRTLSHLARSGRVPSLVAGLSDLLGVRPIFALSEGEARRVGMVRGERRVVRAFARVAATELPTDEPLWLSVFHSGDPDVARQVRETLHGVLLVGRSETVQLSPVMGAYTGPGMTGFAAMPLSRRELGGVP